LFFILFFFSSRRRHTRSDRDWSSDVCSSDLYMTEKFAQTIFGVNTFQLRRRPIFTPNVPDSVWRAWQRRPRIRFSDADAVEAGLTVPVITAWQSSDNVTVSFGNKEIGRASCRERGESSVGVVAEKR